MRKRRMNNSHNELADLIIKDPERESKELDKKVSEMSLKEVQQKLPLYGFVFSVKDSIKYNNTRVTGGVLANWNSIYKEDCQFI